MAAGVDGRFVTATAAEPLSLPPFIGICYIQLFQNLANIPPVGHQHISHGLLQHTILIPHLPCHYKLVHCQMCKGETPHTLLPHCSPEDRQTTLLFEVCSPTFHNGVHAEGISSCLQVP